MPRLCSLTWPSVCVSLSCMRAATPACLLGTRPRTSEPWSRDALVWANEEAAQRLAREPYNDASKLANEGGYRSHVKASGLTRNASLGGQPLWDESPWRYIPHALRGIKPVTREPWAHDEAVYNINTTRDTTDDERAGGGALDLGSSSHKTRAKFNKVDRPGFYQPNWEKWSAALSA